MITDAPEIIPETEYEYVAPQDGGQVRFFARTEFEALFGGSAGPGKSWALIIDALGLQFENTILGHAAIKEKNYRAVIFRRESGELSDLIDEAREYYADFGGVFVRTRIGEPGPSFSFPWGSRIYFCHLQRDDDKFKHSGKEYQYVGFDEVTGFLFSQYIFLFTRCRSAIPNLYPRMRSATNPVGKGLRWVRERFAPHLEVNTPRSFITDMSNNKNYRGILVDDSHPDALDRIFIPGILSENEVLCESDPNYRKRILATGANMSKALLEGDWSAMEGQFFDSWRARIHVIEEKDYLSWRDIRANFKLLGGLDYGNVTVLYFGGDDGNGNVILFDELRFDNVVRSEKIKLTKEFISKRGLEKVTIIADTNMWIKDAFDVLESHSPAAEYLKNKIRIIKVNKTPLEKNKGYRQICNETFKNILYFEEDENGKLTKPPIFKVYRRCKSFINTFPDLVADPDNPEDIADGQDDHDYDAAKYMYMNLINRVRIVEDSGKPGGRSENKRVQKILKEFRGSQNKSKSFMRS